MSQIKSIRAIEILDSRGHPTIEVTVFAKGARGTASVPSGASTGDYEALELRDNQQRYFGLGVQKAIHNIHHKISPKLTGIECTRQREIDYLMNELDRTPNKRRLGANAVLAVSLACAAAAADYEKKNLFQYLNSLLPVKRKLVLPRGYFNVINGGKHADNSLSFQEFMIVPRMNSFQDNLRAASEIYHELKTILHNKYGKGSTNVGDEGGFAPKELKKATDALEMLKRAIAKAGYSGKVGIAIDAAASEFYKKGKYLVNGKLLSKYKLLDDYIDLIKKYPIVSIEDPFHQDDFIAFAELTKAVNIQIVSDDLTVTNKDRLEKAIINQSANCLLLKVNQIGTLTEALDAAYLAFNNNWNVMVSHRSGETEDSFIADLAVGLGCGQIKAGAPCRGERTAKYNQLLRIERVL